VDTHSPKRSGSPELHSRPPTAGTPQGWQPRQHPTRRNLIMKTNHIPKSQHDSVLVLAIRCKWEVS
jgi:hypothetical protein